MTQFLESLYRKVCNELSPYKDDSPAVQEVSSIVIDQLLAVDSDSWKRLGNITHQSQWYPDIMQTQLNKLLQEGSVTTWENVANQRLSEIRHEQRFFGFDWIDRDPEPVIIRSSDIMFLFLQQGSPDQPFGYLESQAKALHGLYRVPEKFAVVANGTLFDKRVTRLHFTLPERIPVNRENFLFRLYERRKYFFDRVSEFDIKAGPRNYQTFVSNNKYYV